MFKDSKLNRPISCNPFVDAFKRDLFSNKLRMINHKEFFESSIPAINDKSFNFSQLILWYQISLNSYLVKLYTGRLILYIATMDRPITTICIIFEITSSFPT